MVYIGSGIFGWIPTTANIVGRIIIIIDAKFKSHPKTLSSDGLLAGPSNAANITKANSGITDTFTVRLSIRLQTSVVKIMNARGIVKMQGTMGGHLSTHWLAFKAKMSSYRVSFRVIGFTGFRDFGKEGYFPGFGELGVPGCQH
uniref:Dirigent protein n=1 Tax=Heterorhabditis bacteriophora TaxID=37862 RepID=A0A1I7XCQ7_HETBA